MVTQLESGGVPLDESLALWERGERLAQVCQRWLDGAQAKIDAARSTRSVPCRAGWCQDEDTPGHEETPVIRFLLSVAISLVSAALALLVAARFIDGVTVQLAGFVVAVVVFAAAQGLLAPQGRRGGGPARARHRRLRLREFGQPSGVAASEEIAGLGITRVRYGNGVVLYVKPTPFEAGAIRVAVRFGSGKIGLPREPAGPRPPGRPRLRRRRARPAQHRRDQPDAGLPSGRVELVIGESGINLVAKTTPADLPLQLDLLAAYVIDPGYRPEAQERYRARIGSAYASMAAVPDGAVSGPISLLVHGGDPRFGMPPQADAERRTLDELRAWLDPMLRQGPLQVMVVGDVDPTRVVAEVGRTFGALPPRGDRSRPAAAHPDAARRRRPGPLHPSGPERSGAGDGLLAHHRPGRRPDRIGLDLVADILADRLLREVREREGATYSPEVYSQQSLALPGYGYIAAAIDAQPRTRRGSWS